MKILAGMALAAVVIPAMAGEVFFEARGPVTDKTEGFRFGNVTFTDNDRVCAKFESVEMCDGLSGRLTTKKLRIPGKTEGKGAYFKFSFDAQYTFKSGNGGKPQRCNQGVFFYDRQGRVLPDCYDTMYPGETAHHYERVLYAWDEVDTIEIFFQKPWSMNADRGDSCTLNISNVKVETATWEDAAKFCDETYAKLPPLEWRPDGDCTKLIPRTMDALKTGRPWRVVMLGDSIQQDSFHSQFHALVKRVYPKSNVEWILSMRGGTGCWHYILAENFYRYVVDHKPDLLIVGGISNYRRHDDSADGRDVGPTGHDAMIRVAKLARERLGCEVLIINDPLAVDTRQYDEAHPELPLPKMGWNVQQYEMTSKRGWNYEALKGGCRGAGIQWWDAEVPSYTWLYGSGLPFGYYSRDAVHSGELGKQIIGHILLGYFTSASDGVVPATSVQPRSDFAMSNGRVYATVDATLGGRVLEFGRAGGRNWLWRDESVRYPFATDVWRNIGGEKTWVGKIGDWSAQFALTCGWPPPAWFDSDPFTVERADSARVELLSRVSPGDFWKVDLRRQMRFEDDALVIRSVVATKAATEEKPERMWNWSVTQVPEAKRLAVHLVGRRRMQWGDPKGEAVKPVGRDGDWVYYNFADFGISGLMNYDADAIAAEYDDGWLMVRHRADPATIDPFEKPRCAVYHTGLMPSMNGDAAKRYVELEFLCYGPDTQMEVVLSVVDDPARVPGLSPAEQTR